MILSKQAGYQTASSLIPAGIKGKRPVGPLLPKAEDKHGAPRCVWRSSYTSATGCVLTFLVRLFNTRLPGERPGRRRRRSRAKQNENEVSNREPGGITQNIGLTITGNSKGKSSLLGGKRYREAKVKTGVGVGTNTSRVSPRTHSNGQ